MLLQINHITKTYNVNSSFKRKKQTVDKMDFIVQKTHWIVSAIIRIGKIPCIT